MASSKSQLIKLLLKSLKTETQALTELKWIQQELPESRWQEACEARSRYYPLQYILGSQPFGNMDIKCSENVLIPRSDTEEWTSALCDEIMKVNSDLKILDVCTGTGCIGLSLSTLKNVVKVTGIDLNPDAVLLSKENLQRNQEMINPRCEVEFQLGDVFNLEQDIKSIKYDLIVSNPPYIPETDFNESGGVEKSVLMYEPKLALLGNLEFYDALVENVVIPSESKAFVFELGYRDQATATIATLKKLSYLRKKKSSWECGIRFDSANNIRNVVGWDKETELDLADLCDEIITNNV